MPSTASEPGYVVNLDMSALGRVFDDQSQSRVRLESEAVLVILENVEAGKVKWVHSPALRDEISANPNENARNALIEVIDNLGSTFVVDVVEMERRSTELRRQGITRLDAFHVAFAEVAGAALVTCDDRLIRTMTRVGSPIWIGTPLGYCDQEVNRWTDALT